MREVTYNSAKGKCEYVVKLQKIDEVRYQRRFARRLLEHLVRVRVLPVFVITFERHFEIEAIISVSFISSQGGVDRPTLHPVLHMVFPTMSLPIGLS